MAVDKDTPARLADFLDELDDLHEKAGYFLRRAVVEPERRVMKGVVLLKIVWVDVWRAI
jgi:hypothetical protein